MSRAGILGGSVGRTGFERATAQCLSAVTPGTPTRERVRVGRPPDGYERQRFTICHETGHTLFPGQDARRGQVVLDVNADEVEDLGRRGTKQARRGRRPKAQQNA